MQIALRVSVLLFTQRPYRTTTRWVRQGDCCVYVTPAKCTSQKVWSPSTFDFDAANDGRGPDLREMRLPEALIFFSGQMRRIVSAIAKRTCARRKTNRE